MKLSSVFNSQQKTPTYAKECTEVFEKVKKAMNQLGDVRAKLDKVYIMSCAYMPQACAPTGETQTKKNEQRPILVFVHPRYMEHLRQIFENTKHYTQLEKNVGGKVFFLSRVTFR